MCKLRDNTTHSKGLITWAELAFIPVLYEKSQPGAAIFIERLEATRISSVLPAVLFLA